MQAAFLPVVKVRSATHSIGMLAFTAVGLWIRNESHAPGRTTLQDVLADELCRIAIALLRLGAKRRTPEAWRIASATVEALRAADPEDDVACHKAEAQLAAFLAELRIAMAAAPPTAEGAAALATRLFAFLDLTAVARTYLAYGTGDLLAIMVEAFGLHLAACADHAAASPISISF